jgi:RimJ/RimL family protein N-acetyltransferase
VYSGTLVTLRAFEREDAEAYRGWMNDAAVAALIDRARPVTRIEHDAWYEALVTSSAHAAFAVTEKKGGVLIGLVWLYDIHWRHRRAEVRVVIGDSKAWGSGSGTDALRTLAQVAFGPMNLEKLWADVLATNPRAVGAFEKAGFTREGLLRGDRAAQGGRVDVVRVGRLRSDPAPTG